MKSVYNCPAGGGRGGEGGGFGGGIYRKLNKICPLSLQILDELFIVQYTTHV